jgi:phosphatidylethanolamine/phosphatidyl-N-methylethanolamine N-methyltransferase
MNSPAPLAPRLKKKPDFRDEARFIKNWIDKPLIIGAVSPSGKALAKMMAAPIDPELPGQVLEIGPGTGPVTAALIARGVDEARLVLLEFNPDFVTLLRQRFPRATVLQGDAYDVRGLAEGVLTGPLAGIVSSLPLLTKPVPRRARLLNDCFDLAHPGAPFVQFTYMVQPPIPVFAIGEAVATGSPRIWRNVPPARVWTYRRQVTA